MKRARSAGDFVELGASAGVMSLGLNIRGRASSPLTAGYATGFSLFPSVPAARRAKKGFHEPTGSGTGVPPVSSRHGRADGATITPRRAPMHGINVEDRT